MRFSVIAGPRPRADLGQPAAECWRNYVNDAVLADELGYDGAMVGEHHFCFASGTSAPITMLTEIAARTKRIRVGTSVICAPFHNPLTLAENLAALDIVSNGRFDFGVGVGSQWEEFNTFGIPEKEKFGRTWELIDIVERCLHGEEEVFSHKGKYFDFPEVRWIIPPVQKRIPIFWGGFGPQGVTRAAERGYHLIAPDVTGIYQRVMVEHGRRPEDHHIGFVQNVSIGDTWEEAFEAIGEPCQWVANVYATRRNLDGSWPDTSGVVSLEQVREAAKTGTNAGFVRPVVGTVDQIIDYFLKVVRGEHGLITHIGVEARPPGTPTEAVQRTMTRFARDVMPVLKEEAAKLGR